MDEPTKFLSTIQVAITLSGFFASASAATGISEKLADVVRFS
jgi:putative hemolysin